jgi:hypothetical protein
MLRRRDQTMEMLSRGAATGWNVAQSTLSQAAPDPVASNGGDKQFHARVPRRLSRRFPLHLPIR